MIFINNRYTKIYYKIIEIARNRVVPRLGLETHHIIPESFFINRIRPGPIGHVEGNPDHYSNIVSLTLREHAFCHKLLVKMTTGKLKSKMELAIWRMMNGKNKKLFSSREYEFYRQRFIYTIKILNKGKKKKPLRDDQKANLSSKMKGKPKSEIAVENMKNAWVTRDRTVKDSTRELNRIASTNFWSNKEVKEIQSKKRKEFLEKNPEALAKIIANLNKKIPCEYCGIFTNAGNYKRWHGFKCKLNTLCLKN